MPRYKEDSMQGRDPREFAGLIRKGCGIRKQNLERLLNQRGMSAAECGRLVGISNLSAMISGQRRMSNATLLKTAAFLQVSPLYLLDLCDDTSASSFHICSFTKAREQLARLIDTVFSKPSACIPDTIKEGMSWEGSFITQPMIRYQDDVVSFTLPRDAEVFTMARAANEIVKASGDYRDLQELAQDLMEHYPNTAVAMLSVAPIG